jgi:hypothetical protein
MTNRETTGGLDLEAVRRAQDQHDLDLMLPGENGLCCRSALP